MGINTNFMLVDRIENKILGFFDKRKLKSCGSNVSLGLYHYIQGHQYIEIGSDFISGDNVRIEAWDKYKKNKFTPHIVIHNGVCLTNGCYISCCNLIEIDDGCLFGPNVFVTDNFHGNGSKEQLFIPPYDRPLEVKNPVHIGKNVWLGRNVCVMPGVTIGDGAIVGANAVVTHDIPAYSVAVGVPAKVIKNYPTEH